MGVIKNFFLKNAAKMSTKDLPKDQQDFILNIVDKNPELFEKIAKEIKELTDKGKPEMYATFEVMQKYQKDLQSTMQGEDTEKLKQVANSVMGEDSK
ncbi:MAG: hypothetical protein QG614_376 [Patescibacteria group bacterium]|nr:hypothetical protein [Patescibacteria group bacterium]